MAAKEKALIVDRSARNRRSLLCICRRLGLSPVAVSSWAEAETELRGRYYGLIILCLDLRGSPGVEMIREIRGMGLDSCILISAPARKNATIVSCLMLGAYDTILIPIMEKWAEIVIARALERRRYYAGARMKDHYKKLSIIDELTHLHNHRHFHEAMVCALNSAIRYSYPLSVLLIDLDNFKDYNDRHGHLEGDRALRALGAFLGKALRAGDTAARYGGEEFGLILPHTKKLNARATAVRLCRGVEDIHHIQGHHKIADALTVSIGVAAYPNDGDTQDGLLREADKALYKAKRSGKNRVCG